MKTWKKPQMTSNHSFSDALLIEGIHFNNGSANVRFTGLITSETYYMTLSEFDKIIKAGKFENNMIKGEFFMNPNNKIRLYE